LHSESVYTYDLKKDIVISTLSLGVFFGSYLIPATSEIPNLNKNDVNAFDRGLMYNYEGFNTVTTILRPVMGVLPFMTPLILVEWKDFKNDFDIWFTYGLMYAQAVGFTYGTRRAIGRAVGRHRPYDYLADTIDKPITGDSFPSGTTSMSFLPAALVSVTFAAEFPDSKWKVPVIVGSYTLATTVGIARIITGHHFLTDVLTGAAIGSFYGWLIPALHKRNIDNENNMAFHFSGYGAIVSIKL
jgi:membrane-associated phospholipid phosphatase